MSSQADATEVTWCSGSVYLFAVMDQTVLKTHKYDAAQYNPTMNQQLFCWAVVLYLIVQYIFTFAVGPFIVEPKYIIFAWFVFKGIVPYFRNCQEKIDFTFII